MQLTSAEVSEEYFYAKAVPIFSDKYRLHHTGTLLAKKILGIGACVNIFPIDILHFGGNQRFYISPKHY